MNAKPTPNYRQIRGSDITPPPELVQQWRAAASNVPATLSTDSGGRHDYIDFIAAQAAQWGSNQELDACCAVLDGLAYEEAICSNQLRTARRPKPPSLKEDALAALHGIDDQGPTAEQIETIRLALEQLPE